MVIVGISHPMSWNCAACILRDGRLLAFAEEERFTRVKHAPHAYPYRAVHMCLSQAGLTPADVDITAIGFEAPDSRRLRESDVERYLNRELTRGSPAFSLFHRALRHLCTDIAIQAHGRPRYFDHHLSHVASAFIPSGFPAANFISIDGWGGRTSGVIGYWEGGGEPRVFEEIPEALSWGRVWADITGHLGFQPHSAEGKTMGLAPYGKIDELALPDFCEGELGLPNVAAYRRFLAAADTRRAAQDDIEDVHQNIAATLQSYYNRSLLRIGRYLWQRTACGRFVMSGGVALNCSGNGRLAMEPDVKDIFVQPASHDGGTALGAAILAHREATGSWPELGWEHPYLGSGYSDDSIRSALDFAKINYQRVDPAPAVARLLSQDRIVGVFQGRAEVGPRALGNRSILANPTTVKMRDRVNNRVKKREPWRPLAPSVLKESFFDVFDTRLDSPYMLMACPVREEWRSQVPAVTHVDHSARPQSVSACTNPLFHETIQEFERCTGIPLVLNTSFNFFDEPMVNTPGQALATFFRTGLDALIMGSFLVSK
jgi:carbamoyltransferase